MPDLASLTPLGAKSSRCDRIGSITITEVTDRALASLTCRLGQSSAFQAAAETLFGMSCLPSPGTSRAGDPFTLIWTGPAQWFAEAPYASHEDIARIVKAGLGDTASVTEQTDGWVRFDLEGPVVDLLERLCPVPSRRMKTGDATRTLLEHMGCFLICRAAGTHFTLLGPRSFAGSLHHALTAAARSIA